MKKATNFLQVLALAAALLSAKAGFAAQQVTIPEGTVIELRMDSRLNSQESRVNETLKRAC